MAAWTPHDYNEDAGLDCARTLLQVKTRPAFGEYIHRYRPFR